MLASRRAFLVTLAAVASWRPDARAQAQKKTALVGLLWNDSVKPSPFVPFLVEGLRDKGWILNRDYRLEDQVTLKGYEGYGDGLAALLRAKVDVIVTSGSTATTAAAKATKEIPVVFLMGADPVALGLVPSLSRPAGNLTGIATMGGALNQKRMQLLKELAPAVRNVGVVLAPNVGNPIYRRETEAAADALGLNVHFGEAHKVEELDKVIADLAKAGIGAVYIAPASIFQARSAHVVEVIAKHRLPAVYAQERYVDTGGLVVYTASTKKAFIRVGGYVDRVLKGTHPADLAIEQASDAELVVNLKTARSLRIRIPQSLLVRADRVIE